MRNTTPFVFGLVVSCASTAFAQPPAPPRGTDYFPLVTGTKWTYRVGDNEVVVSVAGVEKVKDEDWYRVETRIGKDAKSSEMFALRADGVYRTKVKDDPLVPPVKLLPLPVKAGEKWAVDSKIGTQEVKGVLALKSDRERVKVPAGEFDAVLVEGLNLDIAGAKSTIRIWFARGYGIVKEEFVLQTGDRVVLELFKFEPGVPPPPQVAPEPRSSPEVVILPACAFPPPCRILSRCTPLSVTTQESCGCCARSVRCWVRRR
jgi:hypothetical protein